jgi:hypothetical protein
LLEQFALPDEQDGQAQFMPKLGTLYPSLVRAVQAAFRAAGARADP